MHRASIITASLLLAACDASVEKTLDVFTSRQANLVVLLAKPTQLGPTPKVLVSSTEPMKVLGEWSSLCFSLRGDFPLQDPQAMDRQFAESMGNAKIKVELTLSDGARVALRPPLQAWSLRGKVVEQNELSACASTPCKSDLPIGAQVSQVEVSAEPPLTVRGVYWQSESDLPKPTSGKKQVSSASSPKGRSACSA